ncbi:MAG: amidohydrolase family protein [Pseudomonadota bacterium]
MSWLLTNVRVPNVSEPMDAHLSESGFQLAPQGTSSLTKVANTWDVGGRLLVSSFAELHTHLDKTYSPVTNKQGGLLGAIEAYHGAPLRSDAALYAAAEKALKQALRHGTTRLRTHVNMSSAEDLQRFSVLLELRDRYRKVMDIQFVAMGRLDATGSTFIRQAVGLGADFVGGAPALEPDPASAIKTALKLGQELQVGLDLHIDECEETHPCTLEMLAEAVLSSGFTYPVVAGHCASLAYMTVAHLQEVLAKVADAGLHIVGLPMCNMVLLGGGTSPLVRATAPVAAIQSAGVNVCIGADNVQDPFNPYGGYAPLQNLQLSNILHQVTRQQDIEASLELITSNARLAFTSDPNVISDWVLLDSDNLVDAICSATRCLATFRGAERVYFREDVEHWTI